MLEHLHFPVKSAHAKALNPSPWRASMHPVASTPGERIRWRREQLGMKQKELADALGISPGAMVKYEKDRVAMGAERALDTADILGVRVKWMLRNEGPMTDDLDESYVEPISEPPLLKRARESGSWPAWVLAAVPAFFHHRDGRYSYGELVDFLDKIHDAGRDELERLKNRIGPPKRKP